MAEMFERLRFSTASVFSIMTLLVAMAFGAGRYENKLEALQNDRSRDHAAIVALSGEMKSLNVELTNVRLEIAGFRADLRRQK